MVIDENPQSDVEVQAIAFVDKPAIEKNFMAFSDARVMFDADAERQIVSGPAMIPDSLIYRRDENGEYNVFFSKPTVEAIALKYFKKDYQKNINLFHDPNLSVDGVTIFESFISDSKRGIQPMKGFEDLPDGTWFISAKVENPEVWAKIKSGEVKGFSVEGYFATKRQPQNATDQHSSYFKQIDFMSKVTDLMAKLKKELFDAPLPPVPGTPPGVPPTTPAAAAPPVTQPEKKFAEYTTKDGKALSVDKLEVGGMVTMNGQPCAPGDYELSDGTKLTVGEGGVISSVTPVQMAAQITMEQVNQAIQQAIEAFKISQVAANQQYEKKITDQAALINKQTETIKEVFTLVEQIAGEPLQTPLESSSQKFKKEHIDLKEQRLERLKENFKKFKIA